MPRLALAVAVAAALASTLVAPSGSAQTLVQPTSANVDRGRSRGQLAYDTINRQDCTSNERVTVNMPVAAGATDINSLEIEVWEGDGCDVKETRLEGLLCDRVRPPEQARIDTMDLDLYIRDIVAPDSIQTPGMLDETVCTPESGSRGKQNLTLHFVLTDPNDNTIASTTWQVTVDLLGPPQPRSVSAGIGESALVVDWEEPDEAGIIISGYKICWESLGALDPDAGAPACTAMTLIPGEPPASGTSCRDITGATTSGEAKPLNNGVTYAVAVAAKDDFENLGDLSEVACGTPEPVTGFFEAYRDAGGGAGGGFCTLGARPERGVALAFALALAGFTLRRRSRARRIEERS